MTDLADSKTIEAQEARTDAGPRLPELPADAMIIVPVRNFVMFPEVVMPLAIGRPVSINAVRHGIPICSALTT